MDFQTYYHNPKMLAIIDQSLSQGQEIYDLKVRRSKSNDYKEMATN